jgi:hypothetical protein
MKDKQLINELIQRTRTAQQKVRDNLQALGENQLNWKPDESTWSIGQCLDHLLVSDLAYFPQLKKIADKRFHMSLWQRWSPFSRLFGKILVDQVSEVPKKKMKAPKVLKPSESRIPMNIFERFDKHIDSLVDFFSAASSIDIDKTKIYSPVSSFITYNLRHCFLLIVQHLHRHIRQAEKLKSSANFPAA